MKKLNSHSQTGNHRRDAQATHGALSVEEEIKLFEYVEGGLPPVESQRVEAHLANCPDCQRLYEECKELSLQLERGLRRPRLSPDFATRLERRIEAVSEPARLSDPAQRQRAEKEIDAWMAGRQRDFIRQQFARFLDVLGYATVAGIGLHLLVLFLAGRAESSGWAGALAGGRAQASLTAVGAVILLASLWTAGGHRLRRALLPA
jgi:anti-sigma factor RsiW